MVKWSLWDGLGVVKGLAKMFQGCGSEGLPGAVGVQEV